MTPVDRAAEMLSRQTRKAARKFTASVIVTRKGTGCGPYFSKVDQALCRLRARRKVKPGEKVEVQSHAEAVFGFSDDIKTQMTRGEMND